LYVAWFSFMRDLACLAQIHLCEISHVLHKSIYARSRMSCTNSFMRDLACLAQMHTREFMRDLAHLVLLNMAGICPKSVHKYLCEKFMLGKGTGNQSSKATGVTKRCNTSCNHVAKSSEAGPSRSSTDKHVRYPPAKRLTMCKQRFAMN
jgi:hypothetical protein